MSNWDFRWLRLARFFAWEFSKDPSTQVGAVITKPDGKHMASFGYNGFPSKIKDIPELLHNRDEKYPRIIHADMNAILNADGSLKDCTMYTWPYFPCHDCAKHIIQVGIIRVVSLKALPERWKDSQSMAMTLFEEANVEITRIGEI